MSLPHAAALMLHPALHCVCHEGHQVPQRWPVRQHSLAARSAHPVWNLLLAFPVETGMGSAAAIGYRNRVIFFSQHGLYLRASLMVGPQRDPRARRLALSARHRSMHRLSYRNRALSM